MTDFVQNIVGSAAGAFGLALVGWVVAQIKAGSAELQERLANESLERLFDVVSTVVLDSTEVLGRSLVDALKDGNLTGAELKDALNETYEFLWSVMRRVDLARLAGGTDDAAKEAFKRNVLPRLEAEARERARLLKN